MKVIYFHRKPRPNHNFSIEGLFTTVRAHLPGNVQWEVRSLRYCSKGLFKRLYIGFEAALHQRDVNHVTGDINFVALFLRRKKTVLTIHDLGLLVGRGSASRWLLKFFWVQWPVRHAAVITTVSRATRNELLKVVRIDPAKIKVVYVPIAAHFTFAPKTFDKARPTILQMGTTPNKNVHRLVQALKGVPCKIVIVGEVDSSLQETLHQNEVSFEAFQNLSNLAVVQLYHAADVVAFVSTYEGFGMPIVEANAVGRVVITSNLFSMPEVAGDAAHLVDPFDIEAIRAGLLKVIHDDSYRQRLIDNGRINHARFDPREIAAQYAAIYESMCDPRPNQTR